MISKENPQIDLISPTDPNHETSIYVLIKYLYFPSKQPNDTIKYIHEAIVLALLWHMM